MHGTELSGVKDIKNDEDVLNQIKHYLINPVDQRIASLKKPEHLNDETPDIKPVPTLTGFNDLDEIGLNQFLKDNGMAMNLDDLKNELLDLKKKVDSFWGF